MKTPKFTLNKIALASLLITGGSFYANAAFETKASLDANLRYEKVDNDNMAEKDASALTLRTRINIETQLTDIISAVVELEDTRVVKDDYNNGTDNNGYSVVSDFENTELDQGYLQLKKGKLTARIGRQVITMDDERFVGDVGWRQDRQTFDAGYFAYQATDKLNFQYANIKQRNTIFSDKNGNDVVIPTEDRLFNVSYDSSMGKVVGYIYRLDVDSIGPLRIGEEVNTVGAKLTSDDKKFSYHFELAEQTAGINGEHYRAKYFKVEIGMPFDGLKTNVGVEYLGSDHRKYGFKTPLATSHKFNGWADQFINTPKEGLIDIYGTVAGQVGNAGQWSVTYHDFTADSETTLTRHLGNELDVVYGHNFTKNYTAGIKLAMYFAGDDFTVLNSAGQSSQKSAYDTDKFWLWFGAKF